MRTEMMPFFGSKVVPNACDIYGYDCPAPYNYFKSWSTTGGTTIHADGSAKSATNKGKFDSQKINPEGRASGDLDASSWSGTFYGTCD